MEKHFELTINITGDGTEEKKTELLNKTVEKIKIIEASLGNLQLSLTIAEK